jgi:hypothetical protein
MATVSSRTLTDAILAVLDDAGLTVGDGMQPDGSGWQEPRGVASFVPYAVLHNIGGRADGPIDDPSADALSTYQVTGVGATREQAEWVADTARQALLPPGAIESDDCTVQLVTVDRFGGCRRDDTVEPVVWMTSDRFDIQTTP